jgi:hypothetical protein
MISGNNVGFVSRLSCYNVQSSRLMIGTLSCYLRSIHELIPQFMYAEGSDPIKHHKGDINWFK